MGRPPLDRDSQTKYVAVRMPTETFERVEAAAGPGKAAAWIRDAIDERLERGERENG